MQQAGNLEKKRWESREGRGGQIEKHIYFVRHTRLPIHNGMKDNNATGGFQNMVLYKYTILFVYFKWPKVC